MAERPGFMIYFDTAPAFERLDDADAGRLIKALLSYSSMGELLPLDGMASLAFDLIRPKLDRDAEKYVEKIQKRKYAGYSKSCRDRGEEPLDLDSWLEGQNEQVHASACTCMPTVTTTTASTPDTTATAASTTATATTAASKTDTDITVNSRGSGKGGLGENPDDAAEFEKRRSRGLEMLRNYTGG